MFIYIVDNNNNTYLSFIIIVITMLYNVLVHVHVCNEAKGLYSIYMCMYMYMYMYVVGKGFSIVYTCTHVHVHVHVHVHIVQCTLWWLWSGYFCTKRLSHILYTVVVNSQGLIVESIVVSLVCPHTVGKLLSVSITKTVIFLKLAWW